MDIDGFCTRTLTFVTNFVYIEKQTLYLSILFIICIYYIIL